MCLVLFTYYFYLNQLAFFIQTFRKAKKIFFLTRNIHASIEADSKKNY